MLNEFQNEIIVAVVILAIAIIYIISRVKRKNTSSKIVKNKENTSPNTKTEVKKETQIEETHQNNYDESLTGKQEGDFGEINDCCSTYECSINKKKIYKRAPIEHGKITKQNFSEFSGSRILLAEDNLINQKVILGLLADSGIETVIANDGQEVLETLENDDNFLLILMDAHMPRVDGFEATRKIRQNSDYDHIIIVALSGDTAVDDIRKMSEAGMDEHLEKPLNIDALYDLFYSYTGNNDEKYIEVVMTKQLNGDKGLEVCGGDDCFYKEILKEFVLNYANSAKILNDLVEDNKLNEADKLLLDVLGVTANIGARELNVITKNIKTSLNSANNEEYLTLINQYKNSLKSLIEDIKEYI